MRQTGLWMGLFWIGIGVFLILSQWFGRASYSIPKLNISWGWLIMLVGVWRIWWWWISVEQPHRRRLAFEQEQRQMELELEQKIMQQRAEEQNRQQESQTPPKDDAPSKNT